MDTSVELAAPATTAVVRPIGLPATGGRAMSAPRGGQP
ncbi:hypothetical protein SBADM41S_10928 [Streptomyces badius]